jgi:hypothetical protein
VSELKLVIEIQPKSYSMTDEEEVDFLTLFRDTVLKIEELIGFGCELRISSKIEDGV